jgi:nucleotide-binding universal stress UspA family protein
MERVLVGYDGSDHARAAAEMGACLSRHTGAAVTVLAAAQLPAATAAAAAGLAAAGAAAARAGGALAVARGVLGTAVEALVEEAGRGGYEVLIVGHGGRGGLAQILLGSVAKGVAAAAPCPVLVARHPVPAAIDHVLVGVTPAAPSKRAAQASIALARACRARLTLLHVVDMALLAAAPRAESMIHLRHVTGTEGEALLEALSRACRASGVEADALQATGLPADVLLAVAQERSAQVVAIGRPARAGLERLVLGSESDAVLRRAQSAVLITGAGAEVAEPGGPPVPAPVRGGRPVQ